MLHSVDRQYKYDDLSVRRAVCMANADNVFRCHKNVCVLRDNLSGEVIAVIKFKPFSSMSPDEIERIEGVSRFLVAEKRYCYAVKSNSFMRSGYMGALGWRRGYISTHFYGQANSIWLVVESSWFVWTSVHRFVCTSGWAQKEKEAFLPVAQKTTLPCMVGRLVQEAVWCPVWIVTEGSSRSGSAIENPYLWASWR